MQDGRTLRCAPAGRRALSHLTKRERHDQSHPPRAHRRRRRRRARPAVAAIGGGRRRARHRKAGARILPLQGRQLRMHVSERWRSHLPDLERIRDQCQQGSGHRRRRGRVLSPEHGRVPLQSAGDQHRLEAGADRHRLGARRRSGGRPGPAQHGGGRDRPGSGRYRDRLPFSPRPYQRTAESRRRARLSEGGDQGPGTRMGVLDERRQHVEGLRRI